MVRYVQPAATDTVCCLPFVLTCNKVLWFVSQVLYTDNTFAMGHLIQRKKVHVFGDELSLVTLFRCIQNMPETLPNNSCYSAGK